MRILTWMKVLVLHGVILFLLVYGVYHTDWFQKEYLYPFPYQEIIYKYALENELDPFLIVGVMKTESKFIPSARSPKGAIGLMQIMPETAAWIAEKIEYESFTVEALDDPDTNVKFGAWYLASLKKEFGENEILMLAAYNGGRGNVRQWIRQNDWPQSFADISKLPFPETREYVGKVLKNRDKYRSLYGK